MGCVHGVNGDSVKKTQSRSQLSDSFSVELAASRPLTDHREASTIELAPSQRCYSLNSLPTNNSEGAVNAAATTTLSHYNPPAYGDAGARGIAQCAHGSTESVSANKGTFVLSHYTGYHVSDQTFVVDVETRSSKASVFVSSQLSHLPIFAVNSSSGYSPTTLAGAAGPPPLEHLPNYCSTLDVDLNSSNSSTNNSARSVPPPLLCPSTEGGDNSSIDAPVTAANGPNPLVCIPSPPLQMIPIAAPSLLKLEPLSDSPSPLSHSNTALWKPPCSINTTPAESVPSCSVGVSSSPSPPPLAHPPVSLHTASAVFPQPTSIVLYGPPQGLPNTIVVLLY